MDVGVINIYHCFSLHIEVLSTLDYVGVVADLPDFIRLVSLVTLLDLQHGSLPLLVEVRPVGCAVCRKLATRCLVVWHVR